MLAGFNLDKVYQYLLIGLAFIFPLTVFGGNLIVVVICILWIFSGKYKYKYQKIISSNVMLASILFFCMHVIGLIWTEDMKWGFHVVHKMWYFLLFYPILYTIVKKDNIKYYVTAFLIAISLTEIVSYLVWFEVIPPFKNATVINPTPFMSHISYNPILAFAIYLTSYEIFFNKRLIKPKLFLYSFFTVTMTINMFITGGRAGQSMFFAMVAILIFQVLNHQKIKSFIAISLILPIIFFIAYYYSDLFHTRFNETIINIINFSENKNTSVGQRISYAINSWDIIINNPLFGVGTGDFTLENAKQNLVNSPDVQMTTNPHNMYLLIMVQNGIVGLVTMLSIFFYQIKLALNSKNKFMKDAGLTLPLLFLLIMFSDAYLLGHYTTLMFVFFSSFLHNNFEKD